MKLINSLLILVLLTLPLGELLRIEIGNNIFIKPLDLLVGITALITIIYFIVKQKLPKSYIAKSLIIFSVIALLSLIVNLTSLQSNQIIVAFLYLIRFVSYATIYYAVQFLDKTTNAKSKLVLLLAGSVFMILGYAQFFLYANLRNLYYLGWDEHNYRLFSTFLDPNFAGAFLVLFCLFLAGSLKDTIRLKKTKKSIVIGLISILTIGAVFLTYSRSTLLMFVISVTTYLFLIGKKRLVIIPTLLTILFLIILSPSFGKENTNIFRTTSSFARLETYHNAIQIIRDHPVFGVGFNAYRYAQQNYGFRPVDPRFPDNATAGTDNSLLFVTATTGIIGLIAYLYIWFSILKNAFSLNKNSKKNYPAVVISSSFGLFINSFFINSLFYPSIMLWMWILIGFMDQE